MLDEFYQQTEKGAIYINSVYKTRIALDIKTQYVEYIKKLWTNLTHKDSKILNKTLGKGIQQYRKRSLHINRLVEKHQDHLNRCRMSV